MLHDATSWLGKFIVPCTCLSAGPPPGHVCFPPSKLSRWASFLHVQGLLYNPTTTDMAAISLSDMPPSEILSPVERLRRRQRILEEEAAVTIHDVMHLSDRDFAAIIDYLPPDVVRRRLYADDLTGIRCLVRYRGGYWMGSFHHGQIQFNDCGTLSLGEGDFVLENL